MTTPVHAGLEERWSSLSLSEQMGNVGSEVGRTIRSYSLGRTARFDRALARALELFDMTVTDPRWRGARRRELCRAREEFCRLFFDEAVDPASAAGLERYFLHFAFVANAVRQKRMRLAALGGSEPGAAPTPRRRSPTGQSS